MPLIAACPKCRGKIEVEQSDSDQRMQCPLCSAVFLVKKRPAVMNAANAVTAQAPVRARVQAPLGDPPELEVDRPRKRQRDDDVSRDDRPRQRRRDNDGRHDPDDRPRSRYRDDEDDAPRRRRREEEDDDDNPRSRSRGRKPQQQKSSLGLIIGLCGGGVALLLLLVVTGFVWPAFFLSKPDVQVAVANQPAKTDLGKSDVDKNGKTPAKPADDGADAKTPPMIIPPANKQTNAADVLLSYAPRETVFVGNLHVARARKLPGFDPLFAEFKTAMVAHADPMVRTETSDLADDIDQIALCSGEWAKEQFVLAVVSFNRPFREKMSAVLKRDMGVLRKGNDTFETTADFTGQSTRLTFLNDYVCVCGVTQQKSLDKLMGARNGTPQVVPALTARVSEVRQKMFWYVVANHGLIKDTLNSAPPDSYRAMEPQFNALKQAKTLSIVCEPFKARELLVDISLDCAQNADADLLKAAVVTYQPVMVNFIKQSLVSDLKTRSMVDEMNNAVQVIQAGPRVTIQAKISENLQRSALVSMQNAIKLSGPGNVFPGGGIKPPPGGGFQPPPGGFQPPPGGMPNPQGKQVAVQALTLKAGFVQVNSQLNNNDGPDAVRFGSCCKVYLVKMTAGKTYEIEMRSTKIDSYLRLENSNHAQLAQDDDSGGGLDARIVFPCQQSGTYRICTTTFQPATGAFSLTVRER